MIGRKYLCDLCYQEVNPKDFYRVKVKSDAFVNYVNHDMTGANRDKFDICRDCILDFKEYVKLVRKERG